jgi:EmrB/QacA subfamily drug resistance transporter
MAPERGTAVDTPASTMSSGRRQLVLAICCLSLFIAGINVTIVNVALPSIGRTFGASVSGLQWTVAAYTLVIACLLMLSGSLGDRFGRRRVFQIGLVVFTLGSLLCSVAPGLGWLVSFRAMQAVGGSMLNPVAMSIIVNTFTDRKERARAVGIWGSVLGLSLAVGPVIGGALVTGVGWRSIFWITVPIDIAAIVLTQRFVPESKAPSPRRFDPAAQALIVVVLASLTYGIIEGPSRGWGSALILGLFALSALGAAVLVAVESHRREPLMDLRFFRSAPFSGANLIAVVAFAALGGFLFLNTLYLQDVRGYSALTAGLFMIPMAVTLAVCAWLSGRIVGRRGPRLPLVLAGPPMALGALLLAHTTSHTPVLYLVVAFALFGIGSGLVTAPISNTAVSGMPIEQAGVAGAVASTGRQVGSSLGVAVTGSLVAAGAGASFTAASHAAWIVIAGCGVAVLLLGLASTGRWALATAKRNGELLARTQTAPNSVSEQADAHYGSSDHRMLVSNLTGT